MKKYYGRENNGKIELFSTINNKRYVIIEDNGEIYCVTEYGEKIPTMAPDLFIKDWIKEGVYLQFDKNPFMTKEEKIKAIIEVLSSGEFYDFSKEGGLFDSFIRYAPDSERKQTVEKEIEWLFQKVL